MQVGHTPTLGRFNPLFTLCVLFTGSWHFEIAFLHHPIEDIPAEREVLGALVHHPCEGYVGYIAWYVVAVPSSDVRVHTGEPALFKASTVLVARRDVPQGWREGAAALV